jgi:hypothetical protein
MLHSRVVYGLTQKHLTRLERLSKDKHSSLLQTFENYGLKKFYNIDTWSSIPKFQIKFSFSVENEAPSLFVEKHFPDSFAD